MTTSRLELPNYYLVKEWDEEQVLDWLKKFQLDDCILAFQSRNINGEALLELTDEKLFAFQDIKIKRRGQLAKCVSECKSQTSQAKKQLSKCIKECKSQTSHAKKFVKNIKIHAKNRNSSVENVEEEDDDEFDGWDTDFDEEDDEEDDQQDTGTLDLQLKLKDKKSPSNNQNYSESSENDAQYADHLQSITTMSTTDTETSSQITTASVNKPSLPKPPSGKPFVKSHPRANIPRSVPMKRPPSQPPPPPIPQPLSSDCLNEDYETPINPVLVVQPVAASLPQPFKPHNSIVSKVVNPSTAKHSANEEINQETYEVVEPPEENYEIVNDCQWTSSTFPSLCEKLNRPIIPPRTAGPQASSPPPLPEKPKKFQESSCASTITNKESTGSPERPLLPRKTSDETIQNGITNTSSGNILTNLLGLRDSKRGTSSILTRTSDQTSNIDTVSILSTDSQSSRSSTPDRNVDEPSPTTSPYIASNTSPADGRKISRTSPQTSDDTSTSVANRPLPPVPVQIQNESLYEYLWFHNIEREAAEEKLLNLSQDGTYLVRPSKRAGQSNPFTLTVLYNKKIFHLNIRHRPDGKFSLGREKPREKAFSTASELILFHQKEPILLTSRGDLVGKTILCTTPEK